jgi:fumarylacetoacetate (FAA) hydrolase
MKLVRFADQSADVFVGELVEDRVVPLAAVPDGGDSEILDIAMGRRPPTQLSAPVGVETVRLLPPVGQPPAIRDFLTFEAHYRETLGRLGQGIPPEWYEIPGFYFSNPSTVVGSDAIVSPPITDELDYELEVAVVIGAECASVSPEDAVRFIAGYTIFNDFSARDIQRREMKLGMGAFKSKDFTNALGPCLATPDELRGVPGKPDALMQARVNGQTYSRDQLTNMHFSFAEMISYASRDSVLLPGDVLGSGTCATGCLFELTATLGVDQYPWLKQGDVVELDVEGIGVLRNVIGTRGPR